MAITKAQLFNKQQIKTAELAKALSHPARIAILEMLIQRDACICEDITNQLPLAQSTVSQHLKALKSAGLIRGDIDGVRVCYCLNKENMEELKSVMGSLLDKLSDSQSCCK